VSLARIHDRCLSVGLPVDGVRSRGGVVEVQLAAGATAEQQAAADRIAAAVLAGDETPEERVARVLRSVSAANLARTLVERGVIALEDLEEQA